GYGAHIAIYYVVYNVGLCICLYDITKLEDSYIFPGDGASHTKVHFRYVVFHPFLDEILMGKIKGCSPEGVHVSLGFFDDIIIPPESLQQPAKFDEAEQVWVWEYETDEGAHDLYMDIGEDIRFRVVDETFIDTSPTGPSTTESSSSTATEEPQRKEAPYTLVRNLLSSPLIRNFFHSRLPPEVVTDSPLSSMERRSDQRGREKDIVRDSIISALPRIKASFRSRPLSSAV
ncbi:unnamed protein product, partial [Ranitomeya imitator]